MTFDGELLLHAFELSFAPLIPLTLWFVLLKMVPADIAALSPKQLDKGYGKLEGGAFGAFLVSAAACAGGWWWYLTATLPGWLPQNEGTVHVIGMEGWYWALPALFLGIVTSPIPTYLIMAPILRGRFWGFIRQQDLKYGGYTRTGFAITACVAVINIPLLYCGWRATANFLPDRVVMHHVFAPPSVQPYTAVKSLEYTKSYSRRRGKADKWVYMIRIRFADGTDWSGNAGDEDGTRTHEVEVLRYVSGKAGVPIANVKE